MKKVLISTDKTRGIGDHIMHRIKELRDKTGLTQAEFALKTGTTAGTVSQWEDGQEVPRPRAQKISEIFGCDLVWLLCEESRKPEDYTISMRLQELRGHFGWNQDKLAKKIGNSKQAVTNWETTNNVPEKSRHLIAEKCGCSYEWLSTGKGKMFDNVEHEPDSDALRDWAIKNGFDHGTAAAIERYVKLPKEKRQAFAETLAYVMLDRPMSDVQKVEEVQLTASGVEIEETVADDKERELQEILLKKPR